MTTGDKVRLFVAFDIPERQRDRVQELIEPLKERWPGARWTRPEDQHVTLKFLGWTGLDAVGDVADVCRRVALQHEPSELRLEALGTFPNPRRARVVWVGLRDETGLAGRLAGALDAGFAALGFTAEGRPFTPHLTVARLKVPVRLEGELPPLDLEGLDPFELRETILFRSHLSPKGSRYEELERFPLGD